MFIFDISPYISGQLQMSHFPYSPPVLDFCQDVVRCRNPVVHPLEKVRKVKSFFSSSDSEYFLVSMDRFAPYPVFGYTPDWQKGKRLGCMKGLQHHDDPSYNKGYELGYNKGHHDGYLKGKQDYNTAYDEGKGLATRRGRRATTPHTTRERVLTTRRGRKA